MIDQEKLALWKALFKEHEESGLSLTAFCERKQVKRPTYHYWKARLKEESKKNDPSVKPVAQTVAFVEVPDVTATRNKEISLQLEWKELKLSITSTEQATLAAWLIKEIQTLC